MDRSWKLPLHRTAEGEAGRATRAPITQRALGRPLLATNDPEDQAGQLAIINMVAFIRHAASFTCPEHTQATLRAHMFRVPHASTCAARFITFLFSLFAEVCFPGTRVGALFLSAPNT